MISIMTALRITRDRAKKCAEYSNEMCLSPRNAEGTETPDRSAFLGVLCVLSNEPARENT